MRQQAIENNEEMVISPLEIWIASVCVGHRIIFLIKKARFQKLNFQLNILQNLKKCIVCTHDQFHNETKPGFLYFQSYF